MYKRILVAAAIMAMLGVTIIGYNVFRTPEAASTTISAIPIAPTAPTSQTNAATNATAIPSATSAPAKPTTAPATPTAVAKATVVIPTATTAPTAEPRTQVFEIVSAQSQARFLIDEVLRGSPVTVVGITDQVAGQIAIDPNNLANTQLGTIQVNARTLVTDNDFRNRAIKNAILDTNTYEFVTFKPTALTGLPTAVKAGEAFTFQITGDLTVKDVTKTVTFDATVTPVSVSELTGTARTNIQYRDFGLNIPDSPAVDTMADNVRLEIDFVARATST